MTSWKKRTIMVTISPPVPVKVVDLKNFARLSLALTEGSQILWKMSHSGKTILALFTAYMYWNGDIPIFSFVEVDPPTKPFLAYKSDSVKGEEVLFASDVEDVKFKYASFVELKSTPPAFLKSLDNEYPDPPQPLMAEVENLHSIIRILLPLSIREGTLFPLWHFKRGGKHVLGTCVPFEHYYEADALPVFFYMKLDNPPGGAFVKYQASRPKGEELSFTDNTADAKYFYTKVVSVEDMPIFKP